MPHRLSFRRRRRGNARATPPPGMQGLNFQRPRPKRRLGVRLPPGLSFRRRRATRQAPPSAGTAARLSFRRRATRPAPPPPGTAGRLRFRRRRATRQASPPAGTARRLSFRGGRANPAGQPAERLARMLIFWRPKGVDAQQSTRADASDPLRLTARLVALGFAACMLQMLVISQIGVLGVTAELAPLVVAATGFLCGSLAGACFGFAVGLFIDLAFVQVLGISSLLFTVIGYGAGRLRELRAPGAPMTRLGLGAVATVLSLGGYGAIEFMLGVNTPVSSGLVSAIVKTTLLNSLIALPVYALTRRVLLRALPASERSANRAATTKRLSPLGRA